MENIQTSQDEGIVSYGEPDAKALAAISPGNSPAQQNGQYGSVDEMLAGATPSPVNPVAQQVPTHFSTIDDLLKDANPNDQPGTISRLGNLVKTFSNAGGAIGSGIYQAETQDLGFSDDTKKWLRHVGIYNDYAKGENSFLKDFNEGLLNPLAAGADAILRLPIAVFEGGAQGLEATGNESAARLARDVRLGPNLMMEHFNLPAPVAEARMNGVIGEGEAGYMGTKEATPEQVQAREAAGVQAPEPQDIHGAAREIAPETFNEYDALSEQRDMLGSQMRELAANRNEEVLASAPHADEIADLERRLQEEELSPRKAQRLQERITELNNQRDSYIEQALSSQSPEYESARQAYEAIDSRMRDLAPDVSAAYRKAQESLPQEEADTAPPAQTEIKPEAAPEPAERQIVTKAILDDVSQKLQAAGRPQEEAEAAGALVAAHYQARSERFGGKYGTAQEMYERDGADIIKARQAKNNKVPELAQQTTLGKIRLATDNAKATIRLFRSANASTFIHETGHHWLDEMLRDAENEIAPPNIVKDAATIRKWLRSTQAEITTAQHERFARGFERYMMEGTAPSRALAGVFAKFKQWLTDIYQTVNNLRSPITEDIRSVFDRLLSANPERIVVAPERGPATSFADAHEAAVSMTSPEEAVPKAQEIKEERREIINTNIPEDYNDITKGTAPSPERRADGSAKPYGNDDATGRASGEEAAIQPTAQVGNSGGEAAPESDQQPGSTGESGSAGRNTTTESPDSAGRATGDTDSANVISRNGEPKYDLIEKRIEKINTPSDVDDFIRNAARDNDAFSDARRGVVSHAQTLALAEAMGVDGNFFDIMRARQSGEAYNAHQLKAAEALFRTLALDATEKSKLPKTPENLAAFEAANQKFLMASNHFMGAASEAGRALNILRTMSKGLKEAKDIQEFFQRNTGKTAADIAKQMDFMSQLDGQPSQAAFIQASKRANFKSMMLEYYINCLISGPMTHMRYMVGNAIKAVETPLVEIPIAAAHGAIRAAFGKDVQDRVYFGEAMAQLYALGRGSADGLRAAITALKDGKSPFLPGETVKQFQPKAIPGKVGKIINVPSTAIEAIHGFSKTVRYTQNIAGLAYRAAKREGLTGADFDRRVAELTKTPTEDMMLAATKDAMKELYMAPTDYNSLSGNLIRATNSSLIAKIIVPFMKIGSQITKEAFVERSPLGIAFSQGVRDNLMGRNGGAARDMQAGKILAGTALMATTASLVASGMATGDGPTDPKQRAQWLLTHRPNTLTIGDITIRYQGLGSLGMLMRFSANMTELAHTWNDEDGGKLAVSFFEGITKSVLDENWMRGVKDALDAIYHPDEYGQRYVQNMAANWLPFSVGMGQVAREIDPTQHIIRSHGMENGFGILDAMRAKVPGLSTGLPPRRDAFGQPINSDNLQNYQNDPVVQRLDALHIYPSQLQRKIRGVQLTDQQYDDYTKIAGISVKMRLDQIVQQSGFSSMPPAAQIETINNTIKAYRENARNAILMKYPDILVQANAAKKKDTTGNVH